jgi:NTE family protein
MKKTPTRRRARPLAAEPRRLRQAGLAAEQELTRKNLPAHCAEVGLVLQGGGALGAYQGGVYQALAEHGYVPHWIAGISIGAINGAIIAGNPGKDRVGRLRGFWERISESLALKPLMGGDWARGLFNEWSALAAASTGIPGFFRPRLPPVWLQPWGTEAALSYYDTAPLRQTLLEFIDFDLINKGSIRLSIGAADIVRGNSVYFDSHDKTYALAPEHIMASAALPPGFPPVEIDGQHYWDGGVLSNTPLDHLLDAERDHNMLVFQIDLFSARGAMPRNLFDVYERHKDILYSSRTRKNTSAFQEAQQLRQSVERLLDKLPANKRRDADVAEIVRKLQKSETLKRSASMSVVHLIYREKYYETQAKDYEFSRLSMEEHWAAGLADARRTLKQEQSWLKPPKDLEAVRIFDLTRERP